MKKADGAFDRDEQHSHWGIDSISYERQMNGKVRMTVAIPAEHGSKVDETAYRRIYMMSFKCLRTKPKWYGSIKNYIDNCKYEVIVGIHVNLLRLHTSIIISVP